MYEKFLDMALSNPDRLHDYINHFTKCADGAKLIKVVHENLLQRTKKITALIRIIYYRYVYIN